jgi:N-acetylglucosaminyldiphosphoundecaprenol N-acetyl-beta-D-mannosaminyltransferase
LSGGSRQTMTPFRLPSICSLLGGMVKRLPMQPSSPSEFNIEMVGHSIRPDDLTREVYGVLGIPVDVIDMAAVLRKIDAAAAGKSPFLLSTPNLNFLVTSRLDPEFRESLLISDLCPADGMPIVWLARLLGVPIKERIAGSDIFEELKSARYATQRLSVFLFGGAEGVAAAACSKLNAEPGGMTCVGSFYPGFCSVDEMSTDTIIDSVNSSNADFLVAALGAKKGQAWLLRNHDRLRIPVRVHLGAAVNFQAGTVTRAPAVMRKWGLEWLWRIKEEPQLWRRYWDDGIVLLQLVLTHVVPLVILSRWNRLRWGGKAQDLLIKRTEDHKSVILSINGAAIAQNVGNALPYFQDAVGAAKDIVINFTDTRPIDARFLGLLIMLNKTLKRQQLHLTFTGISPRIARIFRLHGFGFLLCT